MKLFQKLKGKIAESKLSPKKVMSTMALSLAFTSLVTGKAFAAQTTPAPLDLSQITTAITSQISVAQVAGIVATVIGASMAFVLFWFGARKLVKTIVTAFKTGKIKF